MNLPVHGTVKAYQTSAPITPHEPVGDEVVAPMVVPVVVPVPIGIAVAQSSFAGGSRRTMFTAPEFGAEEPHVPTWT